jgi:ubiquinone biosynthesis protein
MIGLIRRSLRLAHINLVLVRHGLDEVVLATHLFRPVRFLLFLLPWNWVRSRRAPRAVRLRRALEDLGPIFVKFGQILSTRRDLLPDDLANELARLQDRVPPFPGAQAKKLIEDALGRPVEQLFDAFEHEPLASASIAQVHAARLKSGEEVVVKVVRPGIDRTIRRDIELLYYIARLAHRYWPEARRLRPVEVVAEYEQTIFDELDLQREAANAAQLRRNFADSDLLYVPEIYWDYTRREVVVMERIHGTPISDINSLRNHGVDLRTLAHQGVTIFFTQVFKHNFFHADMHPGNIFVSHDGQYIAVDFGIVGTLSASDQRYLAENFLAFFNRDYHRVAELHVESGWVPADTRVEQFEAAIRTVCEPIFERPLREISFGHLLLRLFQTARRFHMEIQPQLVLLQKTLLNIEGLGRQLYPDLDLWQTAKPFFERWMSERVGVRALRDQIQANAPGWIKAAPEIPGLVHQLLSRSAQGQLEITIRARELDEIRLEMRRGQRRHYLVVVGAALLVSASILLGLDGIRPQMVAGAPPLTWLLGGIGLLLLVIAWPDEKGRE